MPGDILLTTGPHGLSKLGLLIRKNQINKKDLEISQKLVNQSVSAFCRPKPQYEMLKQIIQSSEFFIQREIGCTDSSDGFYQAISDLSRESKCKAIIDYQKLPRKKTWPIGEKWDQFYFFGGEDYELLISLPRDWASKLMRIDNKITEIGYFTEGSPDIEIKNYPKNKFLRNNSYSHF